jgi:hypothetical protein
VAVVIEGGFVRSVIVQDWPPSFPLPRIVVVDYDIEYATGDDTIFGIPVGDKTVEAFCHSEVPEVYERSLNVLSPRDALAVIGEPVEDREAESAMTVARKLRESIAAFDDELNRKEQSPTGSDYNALFALIDRGLIERLDALSGGAASGG